MNEPLDSMVIDVRANTDAFARDVAQMRSRFDGTLVDGFSRAGNILETGLVGAIRRGNLGFDDLRRTALATMNQITGHAVRGLFAGAAGDGADGGGAPGLGGLVGSLLGLSGRATGGPVAPGEAYVVGEKGPEIFRPAAAGRIEQTGSPANGGNASPGRRDVRVAISVTTPQGSSVPQSLQRSSRQVASAVRRALSAN